jgi:methionyl-tRNA formyltransferase
MKPRAVFFGSDGIALPLLEFLVGNGAVRLVGIVTQPDRPTGRGHRMAATVIASFAEARGIPMIKPEVLDDGVVAWLGEVGCDLIFVMAYGRLLRRNILDLPPAGIYNFHASILPQYRGASPIEAAIASGETETGVSLMRIVEAMDAGDVAAIERVPIGEGDDYTTVAGKIATACPILLEKTIGALLAGTIPWRPQDPAASSYTRKLTKEDGALDFSLAAVDLKNRQRALPPSIGCYLEYGGIPLGVGGVAAEAAHHPGAVPGEIVSVGKDGLKIATGQGTLVIHELQRPGGRMLPVGDFTNGFPLRRGVILPFAESIGLVFPRPYAVKR